METYYSKKDLINAKNNETNYIYDLTDLEEFLEYVPTADVVPRDEYETLRKTMLPSYCQAATEEEAMKIGYERGRAEVAKIFEEIESVLFTVARLCPSADGTIIAKRSEGFYLRREDYYTIKEKYIPN